VKNNYGIPQGPTVQLSLVLIACILHMFFYYAIKKTCVFHMLKEHMLFLYVGYKKFMSFLKCHPFCNVLHPLRFSVKS
jgi:hypothetical protein